VLLFNAVVGCVDDSPVDHAACRIDLDLVTPIVEGFVRHGAIDARELDRLPDLIRIRPLAIAVRRFARAAEDGRLDQARGWWSHYTEADAVAERARAELTRLVTRWT
jgi:Ser/Thr protein kinase RdoA (MazF antagonist)